jgi:hypothetical protein
MKKIITFLAIMFFGLMLQAADLPVGGTITYDGKDAKGNMERSYPVKVQAYEVASGTLLSETSINGPVTDQVMQPWVVTVPDNTTIDYQIYLVLTDSVGNKSDKFLSNVVQLIGADTAAPGSIVKIVIGNKP